MEGGEEMDACEARLFGGILIGGIIRVVEP